MYFRINPIVATLCILPVIALSGCGESDLIELQERELSDARAAYEKAVENSETETGGEDEGDDDIPIPSSPNGIDLNQYNLVFSDEFSDTTLDTTKWNTALSWGPDLVIYDQQQYYVDLLISPDFGYNPFSIDNGSLTITASQTPENLRSAANEQLWLSGVITSANKFDFTYGYIEARVELQEGRGVWPAFWMLSSAFEGLKPELFIMEYDGAKPESLFHNYNYQDAEGNLRSPGQWEVSSPNFSDGFRKVGVLWSPGELLYYIDDEPRYRIVGDNVASQDMYLILNLAMGGVWAGATDSTTPDPVSVSFDYVRVFQLKE